MVCPCTTAHEAPTVAPVWCVGYRKYRRKRPRWERWPIVAPALHSELTHRSAHAVRLVSLP